MPLNTPAVLDAVVDAALARRLSSVRLFTCSLSPASAPALARLIGGRLARLHIFNDHIQAPLLDVHSALLLGTALRASTTLDVLYLSGAGLWHDPAAAVLFISALLFQPTLRLLDLSGNLANTADLRAVAGAALGALVGANASALQTLNIANCDLCDAGLGPLVDALPRNMHLRTLHCDGNDISEAFARDVLLPAVQANVSLRVLELIADDDENEHPAILHELQDMVAARAAAAVPPPS